MAQQADPAIERSLRDLTTTVTECVAVLPTAIEYYASDDPGFDDAVERISTLETRCDEQVQAVRRSIAEADPAFSDAYLFGPDVLELVYEVDRIASETEQFARELSTIEPSLPPATEQSTIEHARRSAAAADRLRRGVDAALDGRPCTEAVDAIRATESACDRLKYETMDGASGPAGSVLIVRQFVVTLDGVPNAIEDAADRLGRLRAASIP